jgi:hypothetical protein
MKKLSMLGLLLFAVLFVSAQKPFEGTISYESTISGEGSEMMAGMMPNSYLIQFLGKDCRAEMKGGMMTGFFGPFIFKGDKGETYMIKDNEKVAYKLDIDANKSAGEKKPVITDMKESKKILGYNCSHYRMIIEDKSGNQTVDVWSTKDLKVLIPAGSPATESLFYQGIDGISLLIEATIPYQTSELKMSFKATTLKEEKPDASLFVIPSTYEVKPFKSPMGGR